MAADDVESAARAAARAAHRNELHREPSIEAWVRGAHRSSGTPPTSWEAYRAAFWAEIERRSRRAPSAPRAAGGAES